MTKSSNVFDLIAFISKLNEKRVLIDFYADWFAPYKVIRPIFA